MSCSNCGACRTCGGRFWMLRLADGNIVPEHNWPGPGEACAGALKPPKAEPEQPKDVGPGADVVAMPATGRPLDAAAWLAEQVSKHDGVMCTVAIVVGPDGSFSLKVFGQPNYPAIAYAAACMITMVGSKTTTTEG